MEFLESNILKSYKEIRHIVTKRLKSEPLEFSLALHTNQEPKEILKNRSKLKGYFKEAKELFFVTQVHQDSIYLLEKEGEIPKEQDIQADAIITQRRGVAIGILSADCVPILLFDTKKKAIGAIHAGWRGAKLNIVSKTVEAMRANFKSEAKDIVAFIAPAIGRCCYEVSIEVANNFRAYPFGIDYKRDRAYLDLKAINYRQLLDSGLSSSSIELSPICTSCSKDEFFSYRALSKCRGRFVSAIMLRANPNGS